MKAAHLPRAQGLLDQLKLERTKFQSIAQAKSVFVQNCTDSSLLDRDRGVICAARPENKEDIEAIIGATLRIQERYIEMLKKELTDLGITDIPTS